MQRLHIETIFHEVRGGCNTVGARPNGRAPARRLWTLGACGKDVVASNATGQPRENRECDCGQTGVLIVADQWAPGGSESKFLSFCAHDGYIVP